ncbi:MAG: GAF and ANTAR domain-containing protein [Ornithinibacter sp.]
MRAVQVDHHTDDANRLLVLADALRPLAGRVGEADGGPVLEEFVSIAVAHVPGASSAGLTLRRGSRVSTEAATDETARRADRLQFDEAAGPGTDAAYHDSVYVTGDVASEPRWPRWGRAVHHELGIRSVLWQRFALLGEPDTRAALSIYSGSPDAFDERAAAMGRVLASHGSLLVSATLARGRARNLLRGLESNREIGVAIGILMQQRQITRDAAFDLLRAASQHSNRKLSEVAREVADTGILAVHHRRGAASSRPTGAV